jgi:hypothetical protein
MNIYFRDKREFHDYQQLKKYPGPQNKVVSWLRAISNNV